MKFISERERQQRQERRAALSEAARKQLDQKVISCAASGYRCELDAALAAGGDSNAVTSRGTPALMTTDQPGCAKTLLEAGADPKKGDAQGVVPVIYHIQAGNLAIVQALREVLPRPVCAELRTTALEVAEVARKCGAGDTHRWVVAAFGL